MIEIVPRSGGSNRISNRADIVTISKVKNNPKTKSRAKMAVVIVIGKNILKELRWIEGDRVVLAHDPDAKEIGISRVHPDNRKSFKLSFSSKGGGHSTVRISDFPEYRFPDFGFARTYKFNLSNGGLVIHYDEPLLPYE